jgi:hypothetical protein
MAKNEPVVNLVKMDDGREVEFTGKRKMLKESIVGEAGSLSVRLDFVNGETRTFTLPADLVAKFALHGAEQKLGDEIAGVDDVEDCIMAIDELTERLSKGEWAAKRESSGMAGTSVLAKALVELTGKPIEAIKTFLAAKTQAEKVALRGNAQLKPIIDRLEASKNAKKNGVDTDSLLGELTTGEGKHAKHPTSTEGHHHAHAAE